MEVLTPGLLCLLFYYIFFQAASSCFLDPVCLLNILNFHYHVWRCKLFYLFWWKFIVIQKCKDISPNFSLNIVVLWFSLIFSCQIAVLCMVGFLILSSIYVNCFNILISLPFYAAVWVIFSDSSLSCSNVSNLVFSSTTQVLILLVFRSYSYTQVLFYFIFTKSAWSFLIVSSIPIID